MVVVFDLLINDLILLGMLLDSFCFELDVMVMGNNDNEKGGMDSVSIYFNSMKIEIFLVFNFIDMCLVWQVFYGTLLLDML